MGGLLREIPGCLSMFVIRLAPLLLGVWLVYSYRAETPLLIVGGIISALGVFWVLPLFAMLPGFSRFGVHVQTANWATNNYRRLLEASRTGGRPEAASQHETILRELLRFRYLRDQTSPAYLRLTRSVGPDTGLFGFVLRVLGEEAQLFDNDAPQYSKLARQVEAAMGRSGLPEQVLWGLEGEDAPAVFAVELFMSAKGYR